MDTRSRGTKKCIIVFFYIICDDYYIIVISGSRRRVQIGTLRSWSILLLNSTRRRKRRKILFLLRISSFVHSDIKLQNESRRHEPNPRKFDKIKKNKNISIVIQRTTCYLYLDVILILLII